ncbi:efflux RND transporter periplasmic adaptor subunit [Aliivibrio fischeri]|uniref:efflux RND transporter periplasmic adaptor subunit n=1 Tax=Aliivibrio fischeri TaxID=668 RepID=UPI0007C56419|nr:efflux RND transporter periplasmic adaptor subunit [Aliivibrio fischeri]
MNRSLYSLLVLTLFILTGCQEENTTEQSKPLYISGFTVNAPVTQEFRSFKGQVVPAEQTPIAFRVTGEIEEVLVKTGDVVKQGQLVAKLEDSKVKQAVNDAKAQYSLASKQYLRGKELNRRAMISKAELDELFANRELAQATYRAAKNQLAYTHLVAPFNGKVLDVYKEQFERAAAGEPIMNVYQNDKVYVRIDLSDNVLAMINPETNRDSYHPTTTFVGLSDSYSMKYLEHTSEPNAQTQTYEMYLSMPQPNVEILPGTSATVNVDMVEAGITSIDGYQVPVTALQAGQKSGLFYVWIIRDGQATKVPVTIRKISGEGAIVSSGIKQGDVLANSNLRKLRDGKKVMLMENQH